MAPRGASGIRPQPDTRPRAGSNPDTATQPLRPEVQRNAGLLRELRGVRNVVQSTAPPLTRPGHCRRRFADSPGGGNRIRTIGPALAKGLSAVVEAEMPDR